MTFFYKKADPVQEHIDSILAQCDYGANIKAVGKQWKDFLNQYPQFEMTAERFTYAGQTSASKLVFLRGIMILTVDNQQHEVPIHFILVSGFPGIAPKAYLSIDNDEEVIK